MSESDSSEDESSEKPFQLDLHASSAYNLQTILSYVAVSLDQENPEYAMAAQTLLYRVNDELMSDEFNDSLDDEIQEAQDKTQEMMDQEIDLGSLGGTSSRGVH